MKRLNILFFSTIGLLVIAFVLHQTGLIAIPGLPVPGTEKAHALEKAADGQEAAAPLPTSFSLAELEQVLANIDSQQRQALLADAAAFEQFVIEQASNTSVLTAARANKVDKQANTAFLMQRTADNVLRERYLNELIATKLPADFPSAEQAREYFEQNRAQFTVPERVHVWQIFLQIPDEADAAEIAGLERQAQRLAQELRSNTLDFAAAARQYSDHEQSKLSGGYMGLIRVPELKPEVEQPLLALPEGRISTPIKTDTGLHIVKRGAKVSALELEFAQVDAQIQSLLRQQAIAQLRQAVYEQASKTYPVDFADGEIEAWRSRLSADLSEDADSGADTGADPSADSDPDPDSDADSDPGAD